jgi:hypothetical protein
MGDWAYAADSRRDVRGVPGRPTFEQALETPEHRPAGARIYDLLFATDCLDIDLDLEVTFEPGDGVDLDCGHDDNSVRR